MEEDLSDLTFPKLQQIDFHLAIFQVNAHLNLSYFLPCLRVIRGANLLDKFALVIYNSPRLVTERPPYFNSICRGYVSIEMKSCPSRKDAWYAIVEPPDENFIRNIDTEEPCDNNVANSVVMWPSRSSEWNSSCRSECGATWEGRGFHSACRGSDVTTDCLICRLVNGKRRCKSSCSRNKTQVAASGLSCNPNTTCEDELDGQCCFHLLSSNFEGAERICGNGGITTITYVDDTLPFRHCKIINGSLVIQIQGKDFARRELEQNLGGVMEVWGSVRVANVSFQTLSFLRNLIEIQGTTRQSDTALTIEDNKNLVSLDPWTFTRLGIGRGIVRIRNNPMLCFNDIVDFFHSLHIDGQMYNQDISTTSNGYYQICSKEKLNVTLRPTDILGSLEVTWHPSKNDILWNVTHYYISYKQAPRNVSLSDDSPRLCDEGWGTIEFRVRESFGVNKLFHYEIQSLLPYTRYAVFVRTHAGVDTKSSKSDVVYGFTSVSYPSPPRDVHGWHVRPASLALMWEPPSSPNGIISHYMVMLHKTDEKTFSSKKLNFCQKEVISWLSDAQRNRLETEETKMDPSSDILLAVEDRNKRNERGHEGFLSLGHNRDKACHCRSHESHVNKSTVVPDIPYCLQKDITTRLKPWEGAAARGSSARDRVKVTPLTNITFQNLPSGHYIVRVFACQSGCPNLPPFHSLRHRTDCNLCSLTSANTSIYIYDRGVEDDVNSFANTSVTTIQRKDESSGGFLHISWTQPRTPSPILGYVLNFADEGGNKQCFNESGEEESVKIPFKNMLRGNISFQIQVITVASIGEFSPQLFALIPPHSGTRKWTYKETITLVIGILGILAIVAASSYAAPILKRKKLPKYQSGSEAHQEFNAEEILQLNVDLSLEEKNVDRGAHGKVLLGTLKFPHEETPIRVAVKIPLVNIRKAKEEAKIALYLKHERIVKTFGVVFHENTYYGFAMEFMGNRDLHKYLKKQRTLLPPKLIGKMGLHIAEALDYLGSKDLLHRDVAARNCLVDQDKNVKLADFGFAVPLYNYQDLKNDTTLLPIRWMAPESIKNEQFSIKSDVWSYGILLWEILTNGRTPFEEIKNLERVKHIIVEDKGCLRIPETCPSKLYRILIKCWEFDPENRPSFSDIKRDMLQYLMEEGQMNYMRSLFVQTHQSVLSRQREGNDYTIMDRCIIDRGSEGSQDSCIQYNNNPVKSGSENKPRTNTTSLHVPVAIALPTENYVHPPSTDGLMEYQPSVKIRCEKESKPLFLTNKSCNSLYNYRPPTQADTLKEWHNCGHSVSCTMETTRFPSSQKASQFYFSEDSSVSERLLGADYANRKDMPVTSRVSPIISHLKTLRSSGSLIGTPSSSPCSSSGSLCKGRGRRLIHKSSSITNDSIELLTPNSP